MVLNSPKPSRRRRVKFAVDQTFSTKPSIAISKRRRRLAGVRPFRFIAVASISALYDSQRHPSFTECERGNFSNLRDLGEPISAEDSPVLDKTAMGVRFSVPFGVGEASVDAPLLRSLEDAWNVKVTNLRVDIHWKGQQCTRSYSIRKAMNFCTQNPSLPTPPLSTSGDCIAPRLIPSTVHSISPNGAPKAEELRSFKAPFVSKLYEFAVLTLTAIWRDDVVPSVYRVPRSVNTPLSTLTQDAVGGSPWKSNHQLSSLHSPVTPKVPSPSKQVQSLYFPHSERDDKAAFALHDVLSLKDYVREVLRRSRTTRSVLQSALCYIVALRDKIPRVAELETSESLPTEDIKPRIEIGYQEAQDSLANVSNELPPLPSLPSPLLCPRRSFLAALILATKCLQDRCPSNKFWAKICGLEAREVSRCERALGEALEWRLWVGKPMSGT